MLNNFRRALILPAFAMALAACGPAVLATSPTASGANSCPGAATSSPDFGMSSLGIYNGVSLPNGFATQSKSEAEVTARIAAIANDTSPAGQVNYVIFKCSFPAAAFIYNHRDGAIVASPTASPTASPATAISTAAPVASPTVTPLPSPSASPTAAPTASPSTVPSGVCTSPSASPQIAGAALGPYANLALPNGWPKTKGSDAAVTSSISGLSLDKSADGVNAWASFQCNYPAAYHVWLSITTGAASPSPTPSVH